MTITEKLNTVSQNLDIPFIAVDRKNESAPCAVYVYNRRANDYGDDIRQSDVYLVLINLYTTDKIEKSKENLIKNMEDEGFYLSECQPSLIDDTGYYNTSFIFKIILEEEN